MRALLRDDINRCRGARNYDEFVRRKVAVARRQRDAGLHVSNDEVEADAAARRADLLRRIGEAGM